MAAEAPQWAILRPVLGKPYTLEAERELIVRSQAGDRQALRALLEHYGPVLYRAVLLPRLGNEAAARDALGDTYERVVRAIGRYELHPAGIYPWLRTIALHVAIDQLRTRKRETPFDAEDLAREVDARQSTVGVDVDYLQSVETARTRARVEAALGRIHVRYAQAIRLRVLEERPREEVAATLGATPATFDVLLHRAIAALRRALAEGGEDHGPASA